MINIVTGEIFSDRQNLKNMLYYTNHIPNTSADAYDSQEGVCNLIYADNFVSKE